MIMTIFEFIKECSSYDNPIGDLANDILRDKDFPSKKSEAEIISYLNFKTTQGGTNETFKDFLSEFKSIK